MTYDEFFKIFAENQENLDLNNLNAYINFILENHNKYTDYKEAHHLLPRALFPDYEFNKDNIFNLSAGNHLEAHFLLYKLLPNCSPVIYSINMMVNRGHFDENFDPKEVEMLIEKYKHEYEEYRVKVAKIISESNRGRKRSDEQKKHLSDIHKGKVTVKDNEGRKFRVAINDPRLLSGELVNARVGYKTSNDTKQKMSKSHKQYQGWTYYNNGKEVKLLKEPTEEFCNLGYLEETIMKKRYNAGHEYIHKDGVQKRLKAGETIPEGWSVGRLKHGGFDGSAHINERWFDLKTKEIIDKDPGDVTRYKRYSKDFKEKEYPVYDGRLFTNVVDLMNYVKEKTGFAIPYIFTSVPALIAICTGQLDSLNETNKRKAEKLLFENNIKRLDQKLDIGFVNVYDVNFDEVKFYEYSTPKVYGKKAKK